MSVSSQLLATPSDSAEISAAAAGRPLRVAYVVHTFEIGGIERSVARLASRLDRRRFQPLVVCLNRSGQAAKWIETDDVPVIELHKRPANDLGVVFRLARVLREQRVDIVHSHNWGTLVETSIARRWARVPVHVHAERGTVLGEIKIQGLRGRVRAAAMRWAVGRSSALISNAVAVGRRAAHFSGVPIERIQIIPNGLDAPLPVSQAESNELRKTLPIPAGAILAGSVGRLVDVKNYSCAVNSIAHIAAHGYDVHLVLVGDGPERTKLENEARALGVMARVHFAGWHEDVTRWLAAMDIYVNCSKSEGLSQSLVEAMANGLPLVVTDVGDNALLADGDRGCGLVVPPQDAAALGGAIERLAGAPELRNEFRQNALVRFAERYSIDRMISNYEALYRDLCHAS